MRLKVVADIYHKNKGRYGYCRSTGDLHDRGFHLNHKSELFYLQEFDSMEHFKQQLLEYISY